MARPKTISSPQRTSFYSSSEVRRIITARATKESITRNEALRRIILEWEERRRTSELIQEMIP